MSDPTLKVVIAWSDRRSLCSIVVDALRGIVPDTDLRRAGDDAILAYTTEDAETLRDHLSHLVTANEGLLVTEFEKWSGYGKALDSEWLLSRGH